MREVRISVYNFYELNEEAQDKAYNDYLQFLEDMADVLSAERDDVKQAIQKCDSLQTPWFFRQFLHEINGENIRKELASEFDFLEDGSVFVEPDETEKRPLHYVLSTNFDANGAVVTPYLFRIISTDKNFDIESAIKDATNEYVSTEEGKKILEENAGFFNIGDFALNVPATICKNHGFEQVDQDASHTVIYEDASLV